MSYNKYSATPTTLDGVRFASKAEAARFGELSQLQRAKVISDLKLQPKFPLAVCGKLVCTYIADFQYTENGRPVIEDVKGVKTPSYIIKRKLLLALNPGMDHREVGIRNKRQAKRDRVSIEVAEVFRDAQRKGRT